MIDFMEIGPVPCGESCAQVGQENFRQLASKEMDAYIEQLYRQFNESSEKGVRFVKKWFAHDFGSYGEVCIRYNMDDEESSNYAYFVEGNLPEYWDSEALQELSIERE